MSTTRLIIMKNIHTVISVPKMTGMSKLVNEEMVKSPIPLKLNIDSTKYEPAIRVANQPDEAEIMVILALGNACLYNRLTNRTPFAFAVLIYSWFMTSRNALRDS